jgi:putative serine protease PepD
MKIALIVVGVQAVLACMGKVNAQTNENASFSWSDNASEVQNGIIVLESNGIKFPIGSGFVYGTNNDVVTCKHVLDASEALHATNLLYLAYGVSCSLTRKVTLTNHDIAVFSTTPPLTNCDPFKIGDFDELKVSDAVFYIGFDTRKNCKVVNDSRITLKGTEPFNGGILNFIDFPGIVIPGYSGGAVFNSKREVVGIISQVVSNSAGSFGRALSISMLPSSLTNSIGSCLP